MRLRLHDPARQLKRTVDVPTMFAHSGGMTRTAVPLTADEWFALFCGAAAVDAATLDAAHDLYRHTHPGGDLDAELRALLAAEGQRAPMSEYRP